MAGPNTKEFTDENFDQEVLESPTPVVVDFWAEWCGPCQLIGPTIDELATEYQGKVKVGKLNVDNAQKTAARFQVQSIPTVLVFSGGKEVDRIIGAKRKADYKAAIDSKVGAR